MRTRPIYLAQVTEALRQNNLDIGSETPTRAGDSDDVK